jgi:HEAT repeat protein
MTDKSVRTISTEQLVHQFIELALAQDKAELNGDIRQVNALFDKIETIKVELKSRPGDGRRVLVSLYDHPNAQVRLKAAKATLALEPERARQVLLTIKKRQEQPQALDAGMTLRFLDDGTFTPT